MKIDSGRLTAYAYSFQQPRSSTGSEDFTDSGKGSAVPRTSAPTVAPSLSSTSGFASTLWLVGVEQDKGGVGASPVGEFMQWADMTPAERLRAQILQSMGLEETSLDALPPEERAAIEDQIRRAIEEKLGIKAAADAATEDIAAAGS